MPSGKQGLVGGAQSRGLTNVLLAISEFLRECRSGGNKLSNVRRFINLRSGEGLTFFNKDNGANFSG